MLQLNRLFIGCARRQSQLASIEKIVTKEDLENFAKLSGDDNSIHSGSDAIVHGALLNAYVSAVIGTQMPGHGTIVASQTFRFPKPCHCGDAIVIFVQVEENRRKLTNCNYKIVRKTDNSIVMEGEAKLILPPNT